MDWEDDDDLPPSQLEAALLAAEAAYAERGGGNHPPAQPPAATAGQAAKHEDSGAAPVTALQAAHTVPGPAQQAEEPGAAPPVRRRKLPAALLAGAAAASKLSGGTASAAGPATAAAAAAAADENLPPAVFPGRLHYAFTSCEVDGFCRMLLSSGVGAVGFDIEWRVTYQTGVPPRPVALIQLCSLQTPSSTAAAPAGQPPQHQQHQHQQHSQYQCVLLHIAHSGLTPHLRSILCSTDILKVGVGIHGDALKMLRDFDLEMQGVVCLSEHANARAISASSDAANSAGELAQQAAAPTAPVSAPTAAANGGSGGPCSAAGGSTVADPQQQQQQLLLAAPPQKWSLAALVSRLMGLRLQKSQGLRCSNWEARPPLSWQQQMYAATDAWASLRCYEILSKMPVVVPAPLLPSPAAAVSGGAKLQAGAVGEASGASGTAGVAGSAAEDWVPACAALRHLQPAKLAVHQALVQQGLSVQQVAVQRRIQDDSVQGYMAEAIAAGLGYSWSCLGVPAAALQHVAGVCSELLGRRLAWQPGAAAGELQQQAEQQQQQQEQQKPAQQEQPTQQQSHPVGSKRPAPGSLAGAPAAAVAQPGCPAAVLAGGSGGGQCSAGPAACGGTPPSSSASAPVDVLECLLAAGHKLRELKEERFEGVSYGQLRLALAHLSRCNLGPWQ